MAFRSWLALACVLAALSFASAEKIYMKSDMQGSSVVGDDAAQVLPSGTVGSGYATFLLDTEAKTLTYKVPCSAPPSHVPAAQQQCCFCMLEILGLCHRWAVPQNPRAVPQNPRHSPRILWHKPRKSQYTEPCAQPNVRPGSAC